jgi:uncharacterized membrane protein HdeD (DUF308 family)
MDRQDEIKGDRRLEARAAVSETLADLWWAFVIRGGLAAAVGIAALFWPTGSISLLLRIVGVLLLLDGGLTLLGMRRGVAAGGVGLGAIAIGLVLLIWPAGAARVTFFLLGAWAVVTGIGALVAWNQMPRTDPEKSTARSAGIASLVLGLVLVFWPGSGVVALGWAIAFVALALAALMFWLAARLRTVNERVKMRVVNS